MLQETAFVQVVSVRRKLNDQESYNYRLLNNIENLNNELTKFWGSRNYSY